MLAQYLFVISFSCGILNSQELLKRPTVLISILARNQAHTLPYFLGCLETLDFPKDRLSLWIASDHNSDKTIEILRKWIDNVKDDYHLIWSDFVEENVPYQEETGPAHWTNERFSHVINLREASLNFARKIWADYYWTIDCDVFLTNPHTLTTLISKNFTIASPMLQSGSLYSNFWYGMTNDFYRQRVEEYISVLNREKKGSFSLPMVHSCVLIDLRRTESDSLTYDPNKLLNLDGPIDDIITFANSARMSDVALNLCNDVPFGFVMVPLEQEDKIEVDYEQLTNIKLEVLVEEGPLVASELLKAYTSIPEKDTMGFSKVFMINLVRKPERRKRMRLCFDELGLNVTTFDAVDGKTLSMRVLNNIRALPDYNNPHYHKRTLGEIGCFLSHYHIWREIVNRGYETTLVLEDDVGFKPSFRTNVYNVMNQVKRISGWDLVYLWRRPLQENKEPSVQGSNLLVKPGYSYGTMAYVLSLSGAQKLLNADPLYRLVPVDDYMSIMFDKHPEASWQEQFPLRNLVALSAAPLLAFHVGVRDEQGYISDTS